MRLIRLYENRQKAKTAIKGLDRAFNSDYWARVYVQGQAVFVEAEIPKDDLTTAVGILIHGEVVEEDAIPAITECHEFYRGIGLRRFQPYHGSRR